MSQESAEQTSDEKPKIWRPDEKADDNTKRMAWLLFLEWWKKQTLEDQPDYKESVRQAYLDCLDAAKIIREIELKS